MSGKHYLRYSNYFPCSLANTFHRLRLRNPYRPTNHRASPPHENRHSRMHLPQLSDPNDPQRNIRQRPAVPHPHGHPGGDAQRSGDWGALEVARLARRVLGQGGDGDVEAREARQAAEDEEGEEESVERGT